MIEASSYSVWLYGSRSRGDFDDHSDVDVLVVTDPGNREMTFDLSMYSRTPTVSHYLWNEIERMAEYGSLFLRHV